MTSTAGALVLARDLSLPLDAITEPIGILGNRGTGKTNTAVVFAEELLDAGQQVVVLDPTDVWWGLKSSRDGKHAGYPVVVLGGKHQDLPLASEDGKTIADFVVEERAPVVLSMRHFESKGQELRFTNEFLRRLYYLKGQESAPTPLALIIDEASRVVPQRVMGEEAACVGAVQQVVRQGRSSGLGITLIDQRPATVNKDVLELLEVMIVHRVTGPLNRKTLLGWIEQHDTGNQAKSFLESLASLKRGEAWIWSPGFLDLFVRTTIRERRTFDSSYTPRAGEQRITPSKLADVDLAALKTKLETTIAKARADDPKRLHARIAELEAERDRAAGAADVAIDETDVRQRIDHAVYAEAQRHERIRKIISQGAAAAHSQLTTVRNELSAYINILGESLDAFSGVIAGAEEAASFVGPSEPTSSGLSGNGHPAVSADRAGPTQPRAPGATMPRTSENATRSTSSSPSNGDGTIGAPARKILAAVRQLNVLGIAKPSVIQVALFVGVSHTTGSYNQNVRDLVGDGYLIRESGHVSLTPSGRTGAGPVTEWRNAEHLLQFWYDKLSGPQAAALREIVRTRPRPVTRDALASRLNKSPTTGSFNQDLRDLRTYALIDYASGSVRVSDLLDQLITQASRGGAS